MSDETPTPAQDSDDSECCAGVENMKRLEDLEARVAALEEGAHQHPDGGHDSSPES